MGVFMLTNRELAEIKRRRIEDPDVQALVAELERQREKLRSVRRDCAQVAEPYSQEAAAKVREYAQMEEATNAGYSEWGPIAKSSGVRSVASPAR